MSGRFPPTNPNVPGVDRNFILKRMQAQAPKRVALKRIAVCAEGTMVSEEKALHESNVNNDAQC